MRTEIEDKLVELYKKFSGTLPTKITPLPASGSNRQYYRIENMDKSLIGAFNSDKKENLAFVTFAKHFEQKGLPVPRVYLMDWDSGIYLQEDLGSRTLFDLLEQERKSDSIPENVVSYYKEALSTLIKFQVDAGQDLDYSVCYPRSQFDRQSIMWDLNYFKYYFLKLSGVNFDEQELENDFVHLADYLATAETNYFMYRDFQSRNMMVKDNKLYFIDFQGGRKGALQYDVISLLWSARANLSYELRESLLAYYREELAKCPDIEIEKFDKYYYGYLLIRVLQTLGAYGFRGYIERKEHFLKSIPYGISNLQWLMENKAGEIGLDCKELFSTFRSLIESRNKK